MAFNQLPLVVWRVKGRRIWRIVDPLTNNPARDAHGDFLDNGGHDNPLICDACVRKLNADRSSVITEPLPASVDEGEAVESRAVAEKGSENGLIVDLGRSSITWQDTRHPVKPNAVLVFEAMQKAKGQLVSAGKITGARPNRVFKDLPKPLLDIIEISTKGCRLKIFD